MTADLVAFLKNQGKQALEDPSNAVYFRNVEERLEELFAQPQQTPIQAEIFTFYLLLEHILTILTGDVRYHEQSSSFCDKIFTRMAELLDVLAELIEQGSESKKDFYQELNDTITLYLDSVHNINKLLGERL